MSPNGGKVMNFQEAAIAIGLLTPLILGILAFVEKFIHKPKEPEKEEPKVVQGMTVPVDNYADRLIIELTRERDEAEEANRVLRAKLEAYQERDNR